MMNPSKRPLSMSELQEIGNRRENKLQKELEDYYPSKYGYEIIRFKTPKSPDFWIVSHDGLTVAVIECTNYGINSYMSPSRLYRYIKSLTRFKGNVERVLVVSYPENFSKTFISRTSRKNGRLYYRKVLYTDNQSIERAENLLKDHGIRIDYRHCQD